MPERLQQIPKRLLELWNKYTSKQKTIIISIFSVVMMALAILIVFLNRTKYVTLSTFDTTTVATGVVRLLNENGIKNKLMSDNRTVEVDQKRQTDAIVLISQSDVETTGFGVKDLFNTSISTTNGERLTRNHLYLQSNLKSNIENMVGVVSADINYVPRDTSTTILASQKDTPAAVFLRINDDFDKTSTPEAIAALVAYALGNSSTEQIRIADQYGRVLFDGPKDETQVSQDEIISYRNDLTKAYREAVFACFQAMKYDLTEVVPSIDINMDKKEVYTERHYPDNPDNEQGYYTHYDTYSATGTATSGDIPGTDTNDELDYMLVESGAGNSTIDSTSADYALNVQITNEVYASGLVNRENSSITVVATRILDYGEKDLQRLGFLTEEMDYEQFKLTNAEPIRQEPSEELYDMVSKATGIGRENIHISTFLQYHFVDEVQKQMDWEFILTIVLALLILAFLIYVVFRGMKPVEVTETEPELNYTEILAEHGENVSLDDVEFGEKSETRILIEKFFDENPESVALLLRGWLGEDY